MLFAEEYRLTQYPMGVWNERKTIEPGEKRVKKTCGAHEWRIDGMCEWHISRMAIAKPNERLFNIFGCAVDGRP